MADLPQTFTLTIIDELNVHNFEQVQSINMKSLEGELTALAGHIGTIVTLEPDTQVIFTQHTKQLKCDISHGFAQILPDNIKIITEKANIL